MNSPETNTLDLAAIGGVVATLAGWLPNVAALLSIIWLLIRIIESPTFRAVWQKIFPSAKK